jgi:hypothetical protein
MGSDTRYKKVFEGLPPRSGTYDTSLGLIDFDLYMKEFRDCNNEIVAPEYWFEEVKAAVLISFDEIKKHFKHLSTCNKMQDWTEAQQALSDCPAGPDKYEAEQEMMEKMKTCTCGMEDQLEHIAIMLEI